MTWSEREVWIVDLDHTLVRTDTGVEGFLKWFKKQPLKLLGACRRLIFRRNLPEFKKEVCSNALVDVVLLPYREEMIQRIREAKSRGHRVILATASHQITADAVGKHLGIFDEVLGTVSKNIKGAAKAEAVRELIGDQPCIYWGDSKADFGIWKKSHSAGVVNPSASMLRKLKQIFPSDRISVIEDPAAPRFFWIRAFRIHQWVKNLLIFLPAVGAHRLHEPETFLKTLLGFVAFSCVASAIYLTNDLMDLEADRAHTTKKNRPLASGRLTIGRAILFAAMFLVIGSAVSVFLPAPFRRVLATYFLSTSLYTFWLKQVFLWDVMVLAGLYTLRIFGGSAATAIEPSRWLLAFSMFFFFSLAFIKRYTEFVRHGSAPLGRGYRMEDRRTILALGVSSGMISVLVFSLYISAPEVVSIYHSPGLLWFALPVIFFWLSRMWFLAERGVLHDDPVVFALKDKVSYGVVLAFLVILFFASGVNL